METVEVNNCTCGATPEIERTRKGNGFFVWCPSCGKEAEAMLTQENAINEWHEILKEEDAILND